MGKRGNLVRCLTVDRLLDANSVWVAKQEEAGPGIVMKGGILVGGAAVGHVYLKGQMA